MDHENEAGIGPRRAGPRRNETRHPKKRDARRALGAEGEKRAADFLLERGYRILERNVRYGGVEVDLIVARGSMVAFVEVKTRRSMRYGAPELAVDDDKQRRLVRAAIAWGVETSKRPHRIRFDVVSCRVEAGRDAEQWRIRHIPDAFRPGE